MKDKILLSGIISMLFGITSCSDKGPDFTPVEPGTEINFGSILQQPSDNDTRTYYGPETTIDGKNVWPIYWNESPNNDHIFIYSPQAVAGRNQATYTVECNEPKLDKATKVTKDGSFGVQAGNASTYDFYALYPAQCVKDDASGTTIRGSLPGEQAAVFTGKNSDKNAEEVTKIDKPESGNVNYYMKPDMSACIMTAQTESVTLDAEKPVNLIFKPFSTCVDITINGPETNTTTGETTAYVTEVRLISTTGNLSGDFSYDFKNDELSVVNGTKSISINTKVMDGDGDLTGIPLVSGNTLNLQAFILPNVEIKDLTVQVVTADFKTYSKNLVIKNLGKGQINPVKLPKIDLAEGKVDYSIWLSQLDPRIYVSEVSLPGASAAFTAVLPANDPNKQQTKSLTDLFNAGIRVFQSHINLVNQTSTIDGGSTSIGISAVGTEVKYSDGRTFTLSDVIDTLTKEMANDHSDEFCVLLLSDYGVADADFAKFYGRLKTILDSDKMKNLIVTDFGPNTTIGDIKGKVLVKFAPNAHNNTATTSDMSPLNGTNALFNIWTASSSTQLNYSTLKWATTDGLTNSTSYTAPGANDMLFIHSEQANPYSYATFGGEQWDKNVSDQISSYHKNYSSQTHNIYGMSYLGGAGKDVYIISSHNKTPTDVANHYNEVWTNTVSSYNDKPFGWVVVNMVGIESTDAVIQKVIEQNVNKFKLNRDRSKKQSAPAGDAQAPGAGGPLF